MVLQGLVRRHEHSQHCLLGVRCELRAVEPHSPRPITVEIDTDHHSKPFDAVTQRRVDWNVELASERPPPKSRLRDPWHIVSIWDNKSANLVPQTCVLVVRCKPHQQSSHIAELLL